MRFHSPPFLLRMEAWNQETKDNVNGMHSSCFHPQLQPHCLPAVPLPRTLSCPPACWQDRALTVACVPASPGALGMKARAGQEAHPPPWEGRCPCWPRGRAGTDTGRD